ncbi:hypothetical protein [Streptomyces coerulescens]|uniref:Uncharacterized protein n=1 Tax=Streptomyces coerulescens TaxID=29304 RepID=A0ABW0CFE0_STRCD
MFRGKTARTGVSTLAAALLALQFFAPTASFAHAHTARQAEAKGSAHAPAIPGSAQHRTSRPSASQTPAPLQVSRC